jgi:hypothetical protein
MNRNSLKAYLVGFLVGVAVVFFCFGRYRYEHLGTYLVRINRITQNVSYLSAEGWRDNLPTNSATPVQY